MAPRLDDQACVWGCLHGFLESGGGAHLPVFCLLDNEEVGSATPEGAASTLLRDVLRRITGALGIDEEGYQMLLSRSMLVSADNAHAIHPAHPELSDKDNAPRLNGGIVLRFSAPAPLRHRRRLRRRLPRPVPPGGRAGADHGQSL